MLPVSVFMQNFKFSSVKVLAAKLFNKIRKKLKKTLYFPHVMSKYIYLDKFVLFCMF